ncbi:MAG: PilZ domain-containing protein [Candidatus Hydrogenedentes bacterium]|nr:PilZ domain-containing protein [Candidatus Hydrogenedentota bacterium]
MKPNRRKFSRILSAIPCEISWDTPLATLPGVITSLGFGGASCVLDSEAPFRGPCRLLCAVNGRASGIVAVVRWMRPIGAGQTHIGLDFGLSTYGRIDIVSQLLFQALQEPVEADALPMGALETVHPDRQRKGLADWRGQFGRLTPAPRAASIVLNHAG